MSQQKPSSLELMCYFDGELEAVRASEVEAWLERNPSERKVLDSLQFSQEIFRETQRDYSSADSIANAVMDRIEKADVKTAKAQVIHLQTPASSRQWPVALVAFGGLAAAAVVALAVWKLAGPSLLQNAPVSASRGVTVGSSENSGLSPSSPVSDQDLEPSVSVDAVDFGAHTGTIFYVPTDTGTTTVVWLADEEVGGTR